MSESDGTNMMGINYVRPPLLKFNKGKDHKDYTEYSVETYRAAKEAAEPDQEQDSVFTNDIDSLIYCNDTIQIQMPKPTFMKRTDGSCKFAYAFGMFPNPKNGKASYLDGCILGALGLKRQKSEADVICFITPDISAEDKIKLEEVFDKVIYVPYISPYEMAGSGYHVVKKTDGTQKSIKPTGSHKNALLGSTIKVDGEHCEIIGKTPVGNYDTIMMDEGIFKNCPNYTKEHPYAHVFFKLHIFNPKLFPYEKVCFVDSDLVPMNYYDSLFMLDAPAGWIEYRKKWPFQKSFSWDRCDYLEHGKPIPKIFTETGTKGASDVNAGLMLIEPSQKEYDDMIKQLQSPIASWMGPGKEHIGFYDMDLNKDNSLTGQKFVDSSYCYPEQNYLTKRYSGKWTYIEYSFQSWSLDPCNSFGIHMAAFNPKPWVKQPANVEVKEVKDFQPYFTGKAKKDIFNSEIPKTVTTHNELLGLENISISYELFNDLIIWGLVNFKTLYKFFMGSAKICGTKLSFGEDIFKPFSKKHEFILLKDFTKGTHDFKKLSISQQYISNLLTDNKAFAKTVKDKYLSICKTKFRKDRYGEYTFRSQIIDYPDHIDRTTHEDKSLSSSGKLSFGKDKGLPIDDLSEEDAQFYISTRKFRQSKDIRDAFRKSKFSHLVKREGSYASLKKKKQKRTTNRPSRKRQRTTKKPKITILYFKMKDCKWCSKFEKGPWKKMKRNKEITTKMLLGSHNADLVSKYGIKTYPALVRLEGEKNPKLFRGNRDHSKLLQFVK